MRHTKLAAAAAALALIGGGAAYGTLAAGASPVTSVVKYDMKGTNSVSGWFANAQTVEFTHIHGYIGSDGQGTIGQFSPATIPGTIANGGGLGLCDQFNGRAAQLGDVYIGGGLMDVVYATGWFQPPVVNNADLCENGVVNPAELNDSQHSFGVLLANVPINDTIDADILFNGNHGFNGFGHHHNRGDVVFIVQDISANPGVEVQATSHMWSGTEFGEADAGVVQDSTLVNVLPLAVPEPDGNTNLLIRFAHLMLNGNDDVTGAEVHGSLQSNADWTAYPVAADKNGGPATAGNPVYLAPGVFRNDHFSEFVGSPVG